MSSNEYYNKLLQTCEWQEKREEIFFRDKYTCVCCNSKATDLPNLGKTLNVHHIVYRKNMKPWEYDNSDLITLCDNCHDFITQRIDSCVEIIRRMCIDDDLSEQLEYLLKNISVIKNPWQIRSIAKHIETNIWPKDLPIQTSGEKNL
jgi:hypothetical protein